MKYKILEADPIRGTHKFFVDNISDLEELPKEPGSTTLVANTGDTYICNNIGEWVMYIDNPIEGTNDDNIKIGRLINIMLGDYKPEVGEGIDVQPSVLSVSKNNNFICKTDNNPIAMVAAGFDVSLTPIGGSNNFEFDSIGLSSDGYIENIDKLDIKYTTEWIENINYEGYSVHFTVPELPENHILYVHNFENEMEK